MLKRLIKSFQTIATGGRLVDSNREAALNTIESYGYKAHRYFAAIGNRDNTELSSALDTLENLGYIVTDKEGNLVGKVATARLDSESIAIQRRATFKVIN